MKPMKTSCGSIELLSPHSQKFFLVLAHSVSCPNGKVPPTEPVSRLSSKRLILKVPVNLTSVEIRAYLEAVYGAQVVRVFTQIRAPRKKQFAAGRKRGQYYTARPLHKRAIVQTEYSVPDHIRMVRNPYRVQSDPELLKWNYRSYGAASMPRVVVPRPVIRAGAWKNPIVKLLAPDEAQLNPTVRSSQDETCLPPDLNRPFVHGLAPFRKPSRVNGVTQPPYEPINIAPWREQFSLLLKFGAIQPQGANAGIPTTVPTHPLAHLARRKPDDTRRNPVTRILEPSPSFWHPPH